MRFQDLLDDSADESNPRLTQGQMLILGLNGLFEKMEASLVKLAERIKNAPVESTASTLFHNIREKMVKIV